FRTDYDAGLRTVLEATARISNPATGRIDEPEYHSDWALDSGEVDGHAYFRLTIIQEAADQPFTVLSIVEIIVDDRGTNDHRKRVRDEGEERANTHVIGLVVDSISSAGDLLFHLEDQFEKYENLIFDRDDASYRVEVSARRLGADTGRDVLF